MTENFIKIDDKNCINKNWIRYMYKNDSCFNICLNSLGCSDNYFKMCKKDKESEFKKLDNLSKTFIRADNDVYINKDWLRYYKLTDKGFDLCLKPQGCENRFLTLSKALYPQEYNNLKN